MRRYTELVLPGLSSSSPPHRDLLFKAAKCGLYLPGCVGTREIERAGIEVDLVPETRSLLKLVSTEALGKEMLLVRAQTHTLVLSAA